MDQEEFQTRGNQNYGSLNRESMMRDNMFRGSMFRGSMKRGGLSRGIPGRSFRIEKNSAAVASSGDDERLKQIREVWVMCEAQRQMHRLAFMYYSYRQFRYHALPLTIITMMSGIMAFLSTADMIPNFWQEYLALSVGVLSILSASVQSMSQDARFDSKAEMHKNAALGMKRIADQIEFLQVDPAVNMSTLKLFPVEDVPANPQAVPEVGTDADADPTPALSPAADMPELNVNEISDNDNDNANACATFKEVYQQCLDSCTSQFPVRISQSFKMAESRLTMSLTKADKKVIKDEYGSLGKQIIFRCLYNEVFVTISEHYLFPFRCLSPEVAVEAAMKKVEKCFQKKQINFVRSAPEPSSF